MKKIKTKNESYEIESFDDEFFFNKEYNKASRSKEKMQARKKIEAYLERKWLKNNIGDYIDMNLDDYMDDLDWIEYAPSTANDNHFH